MSFTEIQEAHSQNYRHGSLEFSDSDDLGNSKEDFEGESDRMVRQSQTPVGYPELPLTKETSSTSKATAEKRTSSSATSSRHILRALTQLLIEKGVIRREELVAQIQLVKDREKGPRN